MSHRQLGIRTYLDERAQRYDDESNYDKGDRAFQYRTLRGFLSFVQKAELRCCDLGCGTGFFTHALMEATVDIKCLGIDASEEMLSIAKAKMSSYGDRIEWRLQRIEEIRWEDMAMSFDIVFSSMAFHHLEDAEKWRAFEGVFSILRPGGYFVLFDLFRHDNPQSNDLLEYLACSDMQIRLMEHLGADWVPPELAIDRLIENDRRMRSLEGDKEALLDHTVAALRRAGFDPVVQILQDARIAGLSCARK